MVLNIDVCLGWIEIFVSFMFLSFLTNSHTRRIFRLLEELCRLYRR